MGPRDPEVMCSNPFEAYFLLLFTFPSLIESPGRTKMCISTLHKCKKLSFKIALSTELPIG